MTTGGLGMTDIGNKQAITGLSREFYKKVGKEYGVDEQWKFEPSVALKVMHDFIAKGGIDVIYQSQLKKVRKKGNIIKSIVLQNSNSGSFTVNARQFIDCSYEGDLMAMAGVSYTVGREDNNLYSETLNGVQPAEYHKQSGNHQFPDGMSPYKHPAILQAVWCGASVKISYSHAEREIRKSRLTTSASALPTAQKTEYQLHARQIMIQQNTNSWYAFLWRSPRCGI